MLKYFDDYEEYPRVTGEILPLGELWDYVGTPFLEGFINKSCIGGNTILRAYVLARYTEWDEECEGTIKQYKGSEVPEITSTLVKTKQDRYDILTTKPNYHVHLDSAFMDDVIILKQMDNEYWVFWFDRDCSDSSLGRFVSEDETEVVVKEFDRWILDDLQVARERGEPKIIPNEYFKGWIRS
jgi:hypothetical protein